MNDLQRIELGTMEILKKAGRFLFGKQNEHWKICAGIHGTGRRITRMGMKNKESNSKGEWRMPFSFYLYIKIIRIYFQVLLSTFL